MPNEAPTPPETTQANAGSRPSGTTTPKDDTGAMLLRVTKRFMVPFVLSWAIAFLGGRLDLDWLVNVGLVGVGISMLGLLLWLIH